MIYVLQVSNDDVTIYLYLFPHFEYSQFSVNSYMHMFLLLFLLTLWLHTARKRPWGVDILHTLLCDFNNFFTEESRR